MDCRCPKGFTKYPSTPCPEGKKAIDLSRKNQPGGCPYFINDAESNYCFFKFMHDDGRPIETQKIASLLMVDDNEVKKIIHNFKRRITSLFGIDSVADLFESDWFGLAFSYENIGHG